MRAVVFRVAAAAMAALAGSAGTTASLAQTVSERVVGSLVLTGAPGPGIVISRSGTQMARLERVAGGGERYVTFSGPGETFDRIVPGAAWIDERLVYLGIKGQQAILVDGKRRLTLKGRPTSPQVLARNWPSLDRHHYLSFVTDGKTIGWLLDGKPQAGRLDRLGMVDIRQPLGTPWFAGAQGCEWRLIGHSASASARWDTLHWVRATDDGKLAYVHGERAGEALLHRNGQVLWREPLNSFAISADGQHWMAVADRSAEGADRVALLRDGKVVDQAEVDLSRQRLVMSADGTRWVWELIDADYAGSTYRRPGLPPRKLAQPTLELVLSADGRLVGAVRPSPAQPGKVEIEVDGLTVATADSVRARSLAVGPAMNFIAVTTTGGLSNVVSNKGTGPNFEDVSAVLVLSDGRPAYVAKRGADNVAVRGLAAVRLPVDDVHHLATLRLEADEIRVLGTRGIEVVDLTIRD